MTSFLFLVTLSLLGVSKQELLSLPAKGIEAKGPVGWVFKAPKSAEGIVKGTFEAKDSSLQVQIFAMNRRHSSAAEFLTELDKTHARKTELTKTERESDFAPQVIGEGVSKARGKYLVHAQKVQSSVIQESFVIQNRQRTWMFSWTYQKEKSSAFKKASESFFKDLKLSEVK